MRPYASTDRILSLWGRVEGRGRFWVNDAASLPTWEPSAPFRNLLHWSLADTGLAFAHAAVVGTPAGGESCWRDEVAQEVHDRNGVCRRRMALRRGQ